MAGRLRNLPKMKEFELHEHYHSETEAKNGLDRLIEGMTKAKRTLLITGAGLSTACGIPDYRSPANTRLPTGAGQYHRQQPLSFKPVTYASPSFAHLAITQLVRKGLASMVVTQNVDNLHSKALLPSRALLEVHGNIGKEYCESCGQLHYRNYYCRDRSRPRTTDHFNGRHCSSCNGRLLDSLVFFGESYPTRTKSFMEAIEADLVVVIGSSLTIPSLQRLIRKLAANTFVINIQKPALPEDTVTCQIHHDIQDSFRYISDKLSMKVPPFRIMYNVAVETDATGMHRLQMYDFEMTPVDCIHNLRMVSAAGHQTTQGFNKLYTIDDVRQVSLQLHGYHGQKEIVLDQATLQKMASHHTIMHCEWDPNTTAWRYEPAN